MKAATKERRRLEGDAERTVQLEERGRRNIRNERDALRRQQLDAAEAEEELEARKRRLDHIQQQLRHATKQGF